MPSNFNSDHTSSIIIKECIKILTWKMFFFTSKRSNNYHIDLLQSWVTIWPTYLYLEWPAQWPGEGTPLCWPSPPWPHRSVGEPRGQLLHERGVTSPCSRGQLTGSCGWEGTAWHQSHCDTQGGVHSGGEGAREWGEGLVYLLGMWTDSGDYLLSSVIKVLRVLKYIVPVLIMLLIKQ